jgi:branched-chain amino acid transport system substrate-binding protein
MKSRMVKGKRLGIAILAIALAALLLATACAPTPTAPAEKKVAEIAESTCLTGGAAASEQMGLRARSDYIKYFNEEIGLPGGGTVKHFVMDSDLDTARFIAQYRRFVDRGVPLIFTDFTGGAESVKSTLEKDEMPLFTGAVTGTLVYPPGWVYCPFSTFGEASAVAVDYFLENWEGGRPPRIAYIVSDSPWGRECAEEGVKYAKSIGIEVLPTEITSHVILDSTPNLLRLKGEGVDFIYLQQLMGGFAPILRDAERLGLLGEIQFAGNELGSGGEAMIKMAGIASEGLLMPTWFPWLDETEIPGIKTLIDFEMRHYGHVIRDPTLVGGWIHAAIMCEAVKRAVEEVGYENLDGSAVKRAFDGMKDVDIEGLAKVTYTAEERRGSRMVAVYQIRGGEKVRVSDWRESPILMP